MPRRDPKRDRIEADLDALSAAADLPRDQSVPALRNALTSRNSLLVSRAARHALRLDLRDLTPDLAAAFTRHLDAEDPVEADPQCWAKNDLAKALAQFEHDDSAIYLRGIRFHQLEPVWGGAIDVAGPLRGQCALALTHCRELSTPTVIRALLPLFRDADTPVRVNAARALTNLGGESAALLLRFRAELASDEPELLGACFSGVLALEGEAAMPWLGGFLKAGDDLSAEAAFALAGQRSPAALELLQQALATPHIPRDFRQILFNAIGAMKTPQSEAWLLHQITTNTQHTQQAADALYAATPSPELTTQLRKLGHYPPRT